jgi:Ca2+-binding RTX toxin-like protein
MKERIVSILERSMSEAVRRTTRGRRITLPSVRMFWVVATGLVMLLTIAIPPIKGVLADDTKLGNTGIVNGGDVKKLPDHVIYGTPFDDYLIGTSHDDKINGDFGDDQLKGRGGDDIIQGGGGSDKIYGENGGDFLLGGFGDDLIVGGNGDDNLLGGQDDDTLIGGPGKDYFNCGEGQDVIVDFKPSQGDTRTQDCEVISS